MGKINTSNIIITPLKRIELYGGDVLHALKNNEIGFDYFGEAYFSIIKFDVIKGWKCHTKMTMNLIVPVGDVKFVFFEQNQFPLGIFFNPTQLKWNHALEH